MTVKKGSLFIIFMTVFIDLIGFGIIIPLLPFYAQKFGASVIEIGFLMTSFSLLQFLLSPMWGKISDHVGRRPILLLGLFGSALSYIIFALAPTLQWILISRCIAGICGATISPSFAYISDITTAENRTKGMGIVGAAFGLGFIFGPALTGVFAGHSETLPLYIASGICFANFLLALIRLPESLAEKKTEKLKLSHWLPLNNLWHLIKIPRVPALYAIYFLTIFAFSMMESTFALMGQKLYGFNVQTISYLFVYIGVVLAVMQGGLIGRLSKKFGEKKLMLAGQLALAIGVGLLPFSPNLGIFIGVNTLVAMGFGMNNPSVSSTVSKVAPDKEKGFVLGGVQSMGSLGRILGPVAGTIVFQQFAVSAPFTLGATVLAITLLLTLFFVP